MPDVHPPITQDAGSVSQSAAQKDLEVFNPAYCETMRAMGEQAAKSGAGSAIYPNLKDKASFEQTIADALKEYPRADASVVRRYQECLAEGFYNGDIPFNTGSGGGSSTLLMLGAVGVLGAVGWWMLKGKRR